MLGFVTIREGIGTADRLLSDTATTLQQQGLRLAGAVQDNLDHGPDQACDMDLRILGDSAVIRISQNLGNLAEGCRLDTGALAQAVALAEAVLAKGADLVIINKFGKQESYGRGFREFIAAALTAQIPVLLSVPSEQLDAFLEFAGALAEPVPAEGALDWCRAQTLKAA